MPIIGPTVTVALSPRSASKEALLRCLAGNTAGDPKPELAASMLERQAQLVSDYVTRHAINHDGYRCQWEGFFIDDGDDQDVLLSIGINVLVKDQDFESFDGVLSGDHYLKAATACARDEIARFLGQGGISITDYAISAEADGFGYG